MSKNNSKKEKRHQEYLRYKQEFIKKHGLEAWKERNRKIYQRYMEKNRDKINKRQRETRIKHPERQKEYSRRYREKHRERYNKASKELIHRKWKEVVDVLGDKCCICGFRNRNNKRRRVSFHEIHGKSHPQNPWYVLKHIEDFVPMCKSCHRTLHIYFASNKKFEKLLRLLLEPQPLNNQSLNNRI